MTWVRKKTKGEKEITGKKYPISNIKQIKEIKKKNTLSDRDRLELARARAGFGQEHTMEDGKMKSTTKEERRKEEVENIAQKSIDIETEKEKIREGEKAKQLPQSTEQKIQDVNPETKERLLAFQKSLPEQFQEQYITDPKEQADRLIGIGLMGAAATPTKVMGTKIISKTKNLFKKNSMELSKQKLIKFGKLTERQANIAINKYNSMKATEVIKQLSKPNIAKYAKNLLTGYVTIAGADTIFTWYALDNIADGGKFMIPDAKEALDFKTRTPAEVIDLFEETDLAYDLAIKKVNQSARLNLLTWASRKLIVTGANVKREHYLMKRDNFLKSYGLI